MAAGREKVNEGFRIIPYEKIPKTGKELILGNLFGLLLIFKNQKTVHFNTLLSSVIIRNLNVFCRLFSRSVRTE